MAGPRILFVGDTLLWTSDKTDPLEYVERIWNQHDLIIINLENPITQTCQPAQVKATILFSQPSVLKSLTRFKDKIVVSFANNHVLDCGVSGLTETKKNLDEAGIRYCPLDSSFSTTISDRKITIYSLYEGIDNEFQKSFLNLSKPIDKCLPIDEFSMAFCHWGEEYMLVPHPKVVSTAKRLCGLGFNVTVGHHSHSSQGVTVNADGQLTAYSLGNFNFPDPQWLMGPEWIIARLGYMLSIELNSDGVSWHRLNYLMDKVGSPVCLTSDFIDCYFKDLDKMLIEYLSLSPISRRLVYLRHSSRKFISSNLRFGWIPRIRKGGLRQAFLFLLWTLNYRQIARYPFALVSQDHFWNRYSELLRQWPDFLGSAAPVLRKDFDI